jgi:hypothetical protein
VRKEFGSGAMVTGQVLPDAKSDLLPGA